jgi:Sensors of blue-light using FAD
LIEKIDSELNILNSIVRLKMLVELLYCSISVAPKLTNVDIDQLLASARRRNLAENVTGMLIYHQGEFVQILEGSKNSVESLYEQFIDADPRHTRINKEQQNPISHRRFNEWSMGFLGAPEIESLMPSSAMGILMNRLSDEAKSTSLSLGLRDFVSIYNQMRKSPHRAVTSQKKHMFLGLKNIQKIESKCVSDLAPYALARKISRPETACTLL